MQLNIKQSNSYLNKSLSPIFLVFGLTIFISALLIFQIQPIVARFLLPWFGGSPSVWSSCMVFFQIGLLSGYGYAFTLSRFFTSNKQVLIHITLLVLSILWLPIKQSIVSNEMSFVETPSWTIIKLLFSSVGLPYILLSSTGPLLQHWFAERFPNRSAYRLYSLSNVGSITGLLIYPFVIEPNFGLEEQRAIWGLLYGLVILCCAFTSWSLYKYGKNQIKVKSSPDLRPNSVDAIKLRTIDLILWILLAACGTILLLSATNFICQDVAVVPFIWIIPLSLYLISFTIVFDNPRWYPRWLWLPALFIVIQPLFAQLSDHYNFDTPDLYERTVVCLLAMFIATMVCHGELVRLQPPQRHLTLYYLMIALGGALGGCFVSFIAPLIFNDYWEWPLGFALCLTLSATSYMRSPGFGIKQLTEKSINKLENVRPSSHFVLILFMMQATILGNKISNFSKYFSDAIIDSHRNFYGVIRVSEEGIDESNHRKELLHGNIDHGTQLQSPENKLLPTTYYSFKSGVGTAIVHHPKKKTGEGLNIGVIGLGIGTVATYLTKKDNMIFYEINPDIERFAKTHFTFLEGKEKQVQIVLGDARVSLVRELQNNNKNNFDVLAVDAFSGDAIPIHLLTKEAFGIYFEHLKEDGILAIHVSNKHFNLKPLLYHMAKVFDYQSMWIENEKFSDQAIRSADWVLLTRNRSFTESDDVLELITEWEDDIEENKIIWTDDYSNILHLIDG